MLLVTLSCAAQSLRWNWGQLGGEYRNRVEGYEGAGFQNNRTDTYDLNRFRLNLRLNPASWLKLNFQVQDARVWGKGPKLPPFENTLDLRIAYVEIGDGEKKSFGVRAGRQEFAFGEERLVGPSTWLNSPRSFDAVRLTLRHRGYRLDGFVSSVVPTHAHDFDRPHFGDDLHGLYGGIEKLVPRVVIEPYVFWRVGGVSRFNFATTGFRFAGKLPAKLDYSTELARQDGKVGKAGIEGAWAGHWNIGYTPKAGLRPFLEYNYAAPNFFILYPSGHDNLGQADLFGWRDIHDARAGVEWKAHRKVLIRPSYHDFWLASSTGALYTPAGAVLIKAQQKGNAGRWVGQEADIASVVTVNKNLQIGAGYAHLFPGTFVKRTTAGQAFSYPYVQAVYSF